MPVTQPPYDATHFTLRQTRGEIGIFGSFTSAAAGWGYPCRRLRNLQIFAGESESPSCHTYFVGGAGPVRRARRSGRWKFGANQPEIPAARVRSYTERVALTSPEGSRISRANRAPAPKLCLTDKLRKTRVLRAAEKVS